jgi:D-alanyl-D-alanine dipeptidase
MSEVIEPKDIQVNENNELLVHINEYAPWVRVSEEIWVTPYVRQSVAEKLNEASRNLHRLCDEHPILQHLSSRLSLFVFDALRTEEQQAAYYDHFYEKAKKKFGDDEAKIKAAVDKLVAPIDPDFPSGHLVGGAIDIRLALQLPGYDEPILIDLTQRKDLPHQENRSHYYKKNRGRAATAFKGLPRTIRELRKVLKAALEEAGLVNYKEEYWHFSHGDKLAAQIRGEGKAVYGTPEGNTLGPSYETARAHAVHRFPQPF